ncbi:MAG: hypothetical protein ACTSR3_05905 [Candidatus Helarchaeota archaeon]
MAKYKVKIGIAKTLKNWAITWGIPIILVLVNNIGDWVPEKYIGLAATIAGAVSYFIKNYIQNK